MFLANGMSELTLSLPRLTSVIEAGLAVAIERQRVAIVCNAGAAPPPAHLPGRKVAHGEHDRLHPFKRAISVMRVKQRREPWLSWELDFSKLTMLKRYGTFGRMRETRK